MSIALQWEFLLTRFVIVATPGTGALCTVAAGLSRGPQQGAAACVRRVLSDGLALNLLNPKLSIFFVVFLPQFVRPDAAAFLRRLAERSGLFMLMTFVVFAIYGLFAASVRATSLARAAVMSWMQRSLAAAFGLMAGKPAITER